MSWKCPVCKKQNPLDKNKCAHCGYQYNEQNLVLALKYGIINWFEYFEACKKLPESL